MTEIPLVQVPFTDEMSVIDRHGDRICIFGFSRGAYTARALAGMIEKVGLLPAGNHQQVPFAYKMYIKDDDEGKLLVELSFRFFLSSKSNRVDSKPSIRTFYLLNTIITQFQFHVSAETDILNGYLH